jgi:ATP-dependent Clp protease ATP-binding subunit ClpX
MVSISAGGASLRCSFCGRTGDQVHRVLIGPRANICNECLRECREILAASPG